MKKFIPWTDKEIEMIKQNRNPEGRSLHGVRNKKTRLGLRNRRKSRPKWAETDIKKLTYLRKEGFKLWQICQEMPHYSKNAIQKQLCRIGLAKKTEMRKFPLEVRERLKSFLKNNWEGKTPEDLTVLWNKENARFIATKRKIIRYLTEMGLKISYGEVQKINNLRKREQKAMNMRPYSSRPPGESAPREN